MSLAGTIRGGLVLLLGLSACNRISSDESRYRSAREGHSVKALVRYLHDDFGNEHNEDVRALIAKHYEYAIAHEEPGSPSLQLLKAVASAEDPRVLVRVGAPTLEPDLSEDARGYFAGRHSWDYPFATGLSYAAERHFAYETVVFEYGDAFDFEPDEQTAIVEIQWSLGPSEQYFSGPPSIGALGQPPAPVAGIRIKMTLRLRVPGANEAIERELVGTPTAGFSYSGSSLGFASVEDLYWGMVESAAADAVQEVFPARAL